LVEEEAFGFYLKHQRGHGIGDIEFLQFLLLTFQAVHVLVGEGHIYFLDVSKRFRVEGHWAFDLQKRPILTLLILQIEIIPMHLNPAMHPGHTHILYRNLILHTPTNTHPHIIIRGKCSDMH